MHKDKKGGVVPQGELEGDKFAKIRYVKRIREDKRVVHLTMKEL